MIACTCGMEHPETHRFYVTARNDGGDTVALLGPYNTHPEALEKVELGRQLAHKLDAKAPWFAYGTSGTSDQLMQKRLERQTLAFAAFVSVDLVNDPGPSTVPTPALPDIGRDQAIAAIRAALKRRSGKAWSVTGGTGTAWGWIRVDAPPARRTWSQRELPREPGDATERWEWYDTGAPGRQSSPADRAELAKLLGLETVHAGGVSIPGGRNYYVEHVDRAEGRAPRVIGSPYWD